MQVSQNAKPMRPGLQEGASAGLGLLNVPIQGLSSMGSGQLPSPHLPVPRELGKDQPMAGPGRGFEDLEKKGFCSPPPADWQKLACPAILPLA